MGGVYLDHSGRSWLPVSADEAPTSTSTIDPSSVTNSIRDLGLSCPEGGSFYICSNSDTKFLGCCETDPCANRGFCLQGLRPASFDAAVYDLIKPQKCSRVAHSDALWFSCTNEENGNPPFMGCCTNDPCRHGTCDALYPAALSPNAADADILLRNASTSTTVSSAVLATRTSTASSTPAPAPGGSHGLSTGAVVGIAIGAAAFGILIASYVAFRLGWCRRKKGGDTGEKSANSQVLPAVPAAPAAPALESYDLGPAHPIPSPTLSFVNPAGPYPHSPSGYDRLNPHTAVQNPLGAHPTSLRSPYDQRTVSPIMESHVGSNATSPDPRHVSAMTFMSGLNSNPATPGPRDFHLAELDTRPVSDEQTGRPLELAVTPTSFHAAGSPKSTYQLYRPGKGYGMPIGDVETAGNEAKTMQRQIEP